MRSENCFNAKLHCRACGSPVCYVEHTVRNTLWNERITDHRVIDTLCNDYEANNNRLLYKFIIGDKSVGVVLKKVKIKNNGLTKPAMD